MVATVLLLSGGASTRMGCDKASLQLGDQSLLQWQEQRFRRAGYSVVSRLVDIFKGYNGPLAGLHSACHHFPDIEAWLVVPVDMPLLSLEAIEHLSVIGEQAKNAVCYAGCPLPIYIPNTRLLAQTLTNWLQDADGRRSVYALMEALQGEWLSDHVFHQQLVNLNTPIQWQQFIEGAEKV